MSNILVTGATGNIGTEVIRFLYEMNTSHTIIAGVRNIEKARKELGRFTTLKYVPFDFEDTETFDKALNGIDTLFLLRPPHISDVEKFFRPLIASCKNNSLTEILFLSVQGAEKSKVIPHNKIERLISEYGLDFIFLRPSYFMQNLTTTLLDDIKQKREIILPAGNAPFNWVDNENIGEAAAILLNRFDEYKNDAYELTGLENESFGKVTRWINEAIDQPIRYRNVNPFTFYKIKKQQGMARGMILVMILLHFLPRFQKEPTISAFYERLTGKKPTGLKTFIEREKSKFENL